MTTQAFLLQICEMCSGGAKPWCCDVHHRFVCTPCYRFLGGFEDEIIEFMGRQVRRCGIDWDSFKPFSIEALQDLERALR